MYESFYGHMLSFLLGKYRQVEWLNRIVDVHLTEDPVKLFQSGFNIIYFH